MVSGDGDDGFGSGDEEREFPTNAPESGRLLQPINQYSIADRHRVGDASNTREPSTHEGDRQGTEDVTPQAGTSAS